MTEILGLTIPQWHAALNDFPVALLVLSVAFDLLASGPRREALHTAGYWTLVLAAATGLLAGVSGLVAEEGVEQTAAAHRLVETHEVIGIGLVVVLIALAAWRIWRRNGFSAPEQQSYIVAALVAALVILWTSHIGGNLVFRHAVGIPSETLRQELDTRTAEGVQR